jgi:hypothetical protein
MFDVRFNSHRILSVDTFFWLIGRFLSFAVTKTMSYGFHYFSVISASLLLRAVILLYKTLRRYKIIALYVTNWEMSHFVQRVTQNGVSYPVSYSF